MTKNEYHVNIKNWCHIINNDMLITNTNCIKSKSMIRENVNSLKNIKNNLYSVKKDTDSLSIDLKKLKEEHINKSNKRVKVRFILINIKINRFNKRFNRFNKRLNRFINKASSKDSVIVKNHVDACTETDMPNNKEPCDNEQCDNDNNKSKLQVTINVNYENDDIIKEHTTKDKSIKPEKEVLIHKKNKVVDQVNLISKIRSDYLKNINEISEIMNDLHDDPQLRHIELNKINVLTDISLDLASELCHSGNREWYGLIDNIDTINDKIDLVHEIGELIDSFTENFKKCTDTILKMIHSSNVCVK